MSALEVAEAAVLAELTVGLCVLGWLIPAGAFVTASAVAPMAALGARHRLRVVVAGGVCAVVTGALIAGVGLAANAAGCAVLGSVVGAAERRGWSRPRTLLVAAVTVWPLGSGVAVAALWVLGSLRRLMLVQVTNSWRGTSTVLARIHLHGVAHAGDVAVRWGVTHWWASVPAGLLIGLEAAVFAAQVLARPTLRRLAAGVPLEHHEPMGEGNNEPLAPVPVSLEEVSYRYPGATVDALCEVSMEARAGELLAVVGPNGSGKSTLARLLAGRRPTTGRVMRRGGVGLGAVGGTAIVFQRPESQVLGMRVRDDLMWGLSVHNDATIAELLDRVGLAGFADRDTSTLSGGELQRLAFAAALARRPALLISDESTAMVDAHGRRQLVDLLSRFPAAGIGVVHVTHRDQEAAAASRVLRLHRGRIATEAPDATPTSVTMRVAVGDAVDSEGSVLRLCQVAHVYDKGSPWAHTALHDVNLDIGPGESVLVCGPNGSGKSTLAWILAGLMAPTDGTATIDDRPLTGCLDRLGLSFQHARLQLQRPTVLQDVRAAAGVDDEAAREALVFVGLDPHELGERSIDAISGGQQRRVALAGLIAARPQVLILDEPFAGLDDDAADALTSALVTLRQTLGLTLIVISHDLDNCVGLTERTIQLQHGRVVDDTRPKTDSRSDERAVAVSNRRRSEPRLFRVLPTPGPLHRMWAGTKLLALAAIALVVTVSPQWSTLAVIGALVLAGLVIGRVPVAAAPRLPRWLWVGLLIGLVFAVVAGGPPDVALGPLNVGLAALTDWLRAIVLGVILLSGAALVSWTTALADISPALHQLGRPLRRLRLPVDEWAVVTALGLRSLPLLLEEVQVLAAGRRMRAAHAMRPTRQWRHRLREPADLLAAATVSATRRARECADAIEARGGVAPPPNEPHRLTNIDVAALAVVTLAAIGAYLVGTAY